MNKILIFLFTFLFSTGALCDAYFHGGIGVSGTSFNGHGDTAGVVGIGYPVIEIMGNRIDAIGDYAHAPDEDFYTLGIQVERERLAGPIGAFIRAGATYSDIDGERTIEAPSYKATWYEIPGGRTQTDLSRSGTSYSIGGGVAAPFTEQLDGIFMVMWHDVDDDDFDASSNDSMITGGLRFWF